MSIKDTLKHNQTLHVVGTVVIVALLITVGVYYFEKNAGDVNSSDPVASPQTMISKAKTGQYFEYEIKDVINIYSKFTYADASSPSVDAKMYTKATMGGHVIAEGTVDHLLNSDWVKGFKFLGNQQKTVLGVKTAVGVWEDSSWKVYISADGVMCAYALEDSEGNWTELALKSKHV